MVVSAVLDRMRRAALVSFIATSIWFLQSSVQGAGVTLAWDASSDPNVSSYKLYYGTASGTYGNSMSAGTATTATVSGLPQGITYFFAATAINSSGLESPFSNEINYTVPGTALNQPPTLNAIGDITIAEDAAQQTVSLTGITTGSSNEVQTLTVSATSSSPGLIPNPVVSYTSPNSSGSLSFTPVANANGSATITVTVSDGQATNSTITRSFTVTVNSVNDTPALNSLANLTINESAAQQTVNLSGISSGAANESQTLTVTATSSNPGLIPNPTVSYTSPSATGTLRFTPVPFGFGSATITVTVNDGQSANNTVSRTFTVTVNAVNQAPTLNPLAAMTIAQDAGAQSVSLSGITSGATNENQTLTVTASSSNPTLIPAPAVSYSSPSSTGSLSFTPAAGASGSSTITVTVNDGQAQNNTFSRTFTVTVNAVVANQPPTIDAIPNITVSENSSARTVNLTGITSGGENQTLTVTASSSSPYLIPSPTVNYTSPNSTGAIVFTPVANSYGSATLSVTVNDGGSVNNSITRYFSVTVSQAQNTPPTISGLTNYTTVQDTVAGPLSFTVADAQTAAGYLTLFAYADNPTLVPDANIVFGGQDGNRTVTITPASGQIGTTTIAIMVSDGLASTYGYFNLTVTPDGSKPPPNTPPSISAIANQTIAQGSSAGPIAFVIGDAESPAASLVLSAHSDNQALVPDANILIGGSDANRNVTITPAAATVGLANITVFVSDGMASNSAAFTLTVQAAGPTVAVNISGSGAVTPNLSSQTLTAGNTYSLTAVPNPGQIFCGWSGNMTSTAPRISFLLTSNMNFTATFDPLTVIINGLGTLSTNLAASQSLVEGMTYSVTALPNPGQVFAGWTGSYTSSAPKLTFVMSDDTVLIANFIPNPFFAVQGSYSGLFYEDDGVQQYSAGFISMAVTANGGYSGWLKLGPSKLSFSGSLNSQRVATKVIALNSGTNLTLKFAVQDVGGNRLFGTLSDGSWRSQIHGNPSVFNAATNPCPFAASYTLLMPGQSGDATVPAGYSYGTVRVTSGGSAVFAGTLADGTKISQSVPVYQQGYWPLFASPYSGKGLVMGWMTFENRAGDDMNGAIDWIKLPNRRAAYYPNGFFTESKSVGSLYVAPPNSTTHILNLDTATVAFSGGNLSSDFSNLISLGLSSQVSNLSANSLSLTFNLTTGTFSGSVVQPSNGKSRSFGGAVFQKLNDGGGSLLGGNQSSSLVLSP